MSSRKTDFRLVNRGSTSPNALITSKDIGSLRIISQKDLPQELLVKCQRKMNWICEI